jgi:hypothetical protein
MRFASPKLRLALGAVLLLALGGMGLLLLAPELYEVQDKGRGPGIVPYESGLIYKLRLFDSLTLYAPEEAKPDPDKVTSIVLTAATTMMLMACLLITAARGNRRLRTFFGWAAAGLALVTLDETFALHEMLGHNMHFLGDVPGVERPDDLIFALYPIAAAVFAWQFRDVLFGERRVTILFAVGAFFLVVSAAGDLIGSHVDEVAEPIAGVCLIAGLVLIPARALQRELGLLPLVATRDSGAGVPPLREPVAR